MSRVFWDTNLFIYLFEDYGNFSARVANLRDRMLSRGDHLFTSTFTLGEILIKPLEARDDELRRQYENALEATAVMIPFSAQVARIYAAIRKDRKVKAPDAIQLACAAHAEVDLFITNDEHLSGKTVPGIQFVVSLSRAPY